ncbi:hypothetical protein BOW53_03645 [Solemya pervernicosa gill symbiont]|uniref:Uncharacterized protein n=2 Tax=Gammaproteobacteria incertae sedis TaxID=118884 RepID=A0A1T2L8M4_9GAMM|nr:hypothetical protein BOW53_03645 [Solemya pervernicosa gill symbiont]
MAIVVALSLWLWSGSDAKQHDVEQSATALNTAPVSLLKVQYRHSVASDIERVVKIQGQLEPFRSAVLRAETEETIKEIHVEKGQQVSKGDLLFSLELGDRMERLAEAKAQLLQYQVKLKGIKKLGKTNLSSENSLREAETNLAAANTQLAAIKLDIKHTRIRAPFTGIVNDYLIEVGELVQMGDNLATLVECSRLLATAQVPQLTAGKFSLGQALEIITAADERIKGTITYISSVADEATRSFRIEAEIDNRDRGVAAGMSATLAIPADNVSAHFISPAHLTLGNDGSIGVYIVAEEDRVQFFPIRMLRNESAGTWITGLPEKVRIVTLGQGFVINNQKIIPIAEPDKTAAAAGAVL